MKMFTLILEARKIDGYFLNNAIFIILCTVFI